jgi:hypothetical protein
MIDPALAGQAVAHVLAWPQTYDPEEVLVPAAPSVRRCGSTGACDREAARAAGISVRSRPYRARDRCLS